jgi:DNA-binding LacI/PurR family transcriptional regulator
MTPLSDVIGLVLARPARMLGIEPFFAELIAGLEERLSVDGRSLLLHVVADHEAEMAVYRRWSTGLMVEGVIVVNLHNDDVRIPLLRELGIPAVAIGGPAGGMTISNIWVDDAATVASAVAYLAALGHDDIARVSGPHVLHHTHVRDVAFTKECEQRAMRATVIAGDYSEESGRTRTRALLHGPRPPTAVIYDNDVMALTGLAVAAELGLSVPAELSIIAWDDSTLCRLSNPSLSAMTLDVHAMGIQTAEALISTLADGPPTVYRIPQPQISIRESTASPRAGIDRTASNPYTN